MSNGNLVVPRTEAVEIDGFTRSAFILRGALAAGSVYGLSTVGPFVRQAIAQEGGGDVGILNFALTLELLEATFYEQAIQQVTGLDGELRRLAQEIGQNEREHVDTLRQTIEQLGGRPDPEPQFDFGESFASQDSFLETAITFEDTGVAAYNGAAPDIQSQEVLAAAGSIVQVEGRHAAAVRLQAGETPAPRAFDETATREEVLEDVQPFIRS